MTLCTMSSAIEKLNFISLLDDNYCIALPDTVILNILHAHVRAETLIVFALPYTFHSCQLYKKRAWDKVLTRVKILDHAHF